MRTTKVDADQAAGPQGYDRAAVQSQLSRVLGSPHFKNSKRSQALLRFVVEAALEGRLDSLKERCIGASVFRRESAYDTAEDPIVRNAAIEVRKRLAQYYLEAEHAGELRIDLPIGSYMPAITADPPVAEAPKTRAIGRGQTVKWALTLAVLALAAAAAFLWTFRRTAASELESFWEPLFKDGKTIQICIGQPTRVYRFLGPRTEELNRALGGAAASDRKSGDLSIKASELTWVAPEYVFLRDALSAFDVASWVQSKGRSYQLMSVSDTNYSRLRHAPLVAIGAFNNAWSMRVTSELRFIFDHRTVDGVSYNCIIDRRNPSETTWRVPQPTAGAISDDYAIVTRVFDPATEQTAISAAGIETFGTLAAGEFVTQPAYLGATLQSIKEDWRRKNAQFVLGTRIIDGTPGPPRVLAKNFW